VPANDSRRFQLNLEHVGFSKGREAPSEMDHIRRLATPGVLLRTLGSPGAALALRVRRVA
jgi:hypothetical protein